MSKKQYNIKTKLRRPDTNASKNKKIKKFLKNFAKTLDKTSGGGGKIKMYNITPCQFCAQNSHFLRMAIVTHKTKNLRIISQETKSNNAKSFEQWCSQNKQTQSKKRFGNCKQQSKKKLRATFRKKLCKLQLSSFDCVLDFDDLLNFAKQKVLNNGAVTKKLQAKMLPSKHFERQSKKLQKSLLNCKIKQIAKRANIESFAIFAKQN